MALRFVQSPHSVAETTNRLLAALDGRGITVFARIDHGGGARSVGLQLHDEELVIFGDPSAGTLLMQLDPEVGYELPLRLLVWDAQGRTHVGYRPPAELAERYAVGDRSEVLSRMTGLLEGLIAEATAS
jgi:uncharacterized protein (DUF302 family)